MRFAAEDMIYCDAPMKANIPLDKYVSYRYN